MVDYESLVKKEQTFEEAVESAMSKRYDVLVADIRIPEVKKRGFEVLKVVVPEFHPFYLNEESKALYSAHYGSINADQELVNFQS